MVAMCNIEQIPRSDDSVDKTDLEVNDKWGVWLQI